MLGGIAAGDAHQHRIPAPHHGFDAKEIVGRAVGGIAGEFAERPFLDMGVRLDDALEHDLGMGWNPDAMFRRAHHLERFAKQPASNIALVITEGQPGRGGDHEQRMRADDHRDRHRPAAFLGHVEQPPQMATRMQTGREFVLRVDHCAVVAEIAAAGVRVLRNDHPAGDVLGTVGLEMLQHRKRVEVDVRVRDDLGDRSRGDLFRFDLCARARLIGLVQPALLRVEHPRDALARAEHVADHLDADIVDIPEMEQRRAPLFVQRPDECRHVLVVRDRLLDRHHVVGMRLRIGGEEVPYVLTVELFLACHRLFPCFLPAPQIRRNDGGPTQPDRRHACQAGTAWPAFRFTPA